MISVPTVLQSICLLLAPVSRLGVLFRVAALHRVCSLEAEQFTAIRLTVHPRPFPRVVVSIPTSLSFLASTQLSSASWLL